jgi:hypothetical protein
MVIYRGADGKPGYQQAEDIHDAVTFVEQMRNQDGVEHARIFRLEEVVFEYRPYYRVELSGLTSADAILASTSSLSSAPTPTPTSGSGSPATPPTPSTPIQVGGTEEPSATSALDEPFEVVESTTINVDDPDGEVVAGNGARRGLFGR